MNDNVISLAERISKHQAQAGKDQTAHEWRPADAHADAMHHKTERALKASEAAKLDVIRDCYKKSRLKWLNKNDRLSAAQALGRLMQQSGTRHVTLAEMRECWKDENNGSEFHIHRYSVPQDVDLSDRVRLKEYDEKTKIKLVQPYASRASFIARMKGLQADDCEASLFRNTGLWRRNTPQTTSSEAQPSTEAAALFSALLQNTAARVIRQTDLPRLFQRMRNVPGKWSLEHGFFETSSSMAALFQTAYQEGYEHWSEAPPLPSVPLVRIWHAGLRLPIRLSATQYSGPLTEEERSAAVAPPDGREMPAEFHIYREIRLALGPTVNATAIDALFESRPVVELMTFKNDGTPLWDGPVDFETNWNLEFLGPDKSASAYLGGAWRRFSPLGFLQSKEQSLSAAQAAFSGRPVMSPFNWEVTPLADARLEIESYYLSWTPVDLTYVEHWLLGHEDGRDPPVTNLPAVPKEQATPLKHRAHLFPHPILAHHVEAAIYDGRLAAALHEEVKRIRIAFDRYEAEWLERVRSQTDEVIMELRDDIPSMEPDRDPTPEAS
jgi:hypothetical protein